jgi:hypothetical protein
MDVKGPSDTLLAALAQMRAAREAPAARPAATPVAERPIVERRVAEERPVTPAAAPTPPAHAPGDIRRATPLGSLVDLRV